MVDVKMEPSWKEVLKSELEAPYFERLTNAVKLEYKTNRCFPEGRNIFRAFDLCPFNDVKVVILGQDPYHEIGQAHGLSFSVQEGIAMPPSLINIFKELKNDIGKELPATGDRARRVIAQLHPHRSCASGSEPSKYWLGTFHRCGYQSIEYTPQPPRFYSLGRLCSSQESLYRHHQTLGVRKRSPMSANRGGWFGNHHFSQANNYLISNGIEPINW